VVPILQALLKAGADPDVTNKNRKFLSSSSEQAAEFRSILLGEEVLTHWLRKLELDEFILLFRKNNITLDVVPLLTTEILQEAGITSIGARLKLLAKDKQNLLDKIKEELIKDNLLTKEEKNNEENSEEESSYSGTDDDESDDESDDYDSEEEEDDEGEDEEVGWLTQEDISVAETLGTGASAVVKKGTWSGIDVAIKFVTVKSHTEKFEEEIRLMSKMRHPFILNFYGACLDPLFFVVELAEKGDLHAFIEKENPKWIMRVQFARDIAKGMLYLHSYRPNPIIHRDLKSMNILITEDFKCKVADFGLAKVTGEQNPEMSYGNFTSFAWAAPELIQDNKYSKQTDVYAYGIILWEIVTGEYPWATKNVPQFLNAVKNGERPEIPADLEEPYKQLLIQCWSQFPEERPKFAEIVKMCGKIYDDVKIEEAKKTASPLVVVTKHKKKKKEED